MSRYAFETRKLAVGYDGKPLIQDIEIAIEPGQVMTLIGPNGAGKSTILKSISKQLQIVGGTVLVEGRDLAGISASELANAYTEFDAQAATVDALREALLAGRCRAVLQTPCRWRDKGRSRLQKDRRAGGFSNILRARFYQIACVFRDILHI